MSLKWCLEIRECAIDVPIILVGDTINKSVFFFISLLISGTEMEKRKSGPNEVSTEEGEHLKKLMGAFSFVECSVDAFVGVDDVFIEAIRSVTSRYCFLKPLIKMK